MGGPVGALAGAQTGNAVEGAVEAGVQKRALDIAQKLFSMYTDPQQALLVLNKAVRSGQMPFQLGSQVAKLLEQGRLAGAGAIPAGAGSMLPNALSAQSQQQ